MDRMSTAPLDTDPRLGLRAGPAPDCSIERALELVSTRSALLLMREAFYGVNRFDELTARAGISEPVAAARLKELVADGLLVREPYREPGQRTRSAYHLTEKGAELLSGPGRTDAVGRPLDAGRRRRPGRAHPSRLRGAGAGRVALRRRPPRDRARDPRRPHLGRHPPADGRSPELTKKVYLAGPDSDQCSPPDTGGPADRSVGAQGRCRGLPPGGAARRAAGGREGARPGSPAGPARR